MANDGLLQSLSSYDAHEFALSTSLFGSILSILFFIVCIGGYFVGYRLKGVSAFFNGKRLSKCSCTILFLLATIVICCTPLVWVAWVIYSWVRFSSLYGVFILLVIGGLCLITLGILKWFTNGWNPHCYSAFAMISIGIICLILHQIASSLLLPNITDKTRGVTIALLCLSFIPLVALSQILHNASAVSLQDFDAYSAPLVEHSAASSGTTVVKALRKGKIRHVIAIVVFTLIWLGFLGAVAGAVHDLITDNSSRLVAGGNTLEMLSKNSNLYRRRVTYTTIFVPISLLVVDSTFLLLQHVRPQIARVSSSFSVLSMVSIRVFLICTNLIEFSFMAVSAGLLLPIFFSLLHFANVWRNSHILRETNTKLSIASALQWPVLLVIGNVGLALVSFGIFSGSVQSLSSDTIQSGSEFDLLAYESRVLPLQIFDSVWRQDFVGLFAVLLALLVGLHVAVFRMKCGILAIIAVYLSVVACSLGFVFSADPHQWIFLLGGCVLPIPVYTTWIFCLKIDKEVFKVHDSRKTTTKTHSLLGYTSYWLLLLATLLALTSFSVGGYFLLDAVNDAGASHSIPHLAWVISLLLMSVCCCVAALHHWIRGGDLLARIPLSLLCSGIALYVVPLVVWFAVTTEGLHPGPSVTSSVDGVAVDKSDLWYEGKGRAGLDWEMSSQDITIWCFILVPPAMCILAWAVFSWLGRGRLTRGAMIGLISSACMTIACGLLILLRFSAMIGAVVLVASGVLYSLVTVTLTLRFSTSKSSSTPSFLNFKKSIASTLFSNFNRRIVCSERLTAAQLVCLCLLLLSIVVAIVGAVIFGNHPTKGFLAFTAVTAYILCFVFAASIATNAQFIISLLLNDLSASSSILSTSCSASDMPLISSKILPLMKATFNKHALSAQNVLIVKPCNYSFFLPFSFCAIVFFWGCLATIASTFDPAVGIAIGTLGIVGMLLLITLLKSVQLRKQMEAIHLLEGEREVELLLKKARSSALHATSSSNVFLFSSFHLSPSSFHEIESSLFNNNTSKKTLFSHSADAINFIKNVATLKLYARIFLRKSPSLDQIIQTANNIDGIGNDYIKNLGLEGLSAAVKETKLPFVFDAHFAKDMRTLANELYASLPFLAPLSRSSNAVVLGRQITIASLQLSAIAAHKLAREVSQHASTFALDVESRFCDMVFMHMRRDIEKLKKERNSVDIQPSIIGNHQMKSDNIIQMVVNGIAEILSGDDMETKMKKEEEEQNKIKMEESRLPTLGLSSNLLVAMEKSKPSDEISRLCRFSLHDNLLGRYVHMYSTIGKPLTTFKQKIIEKSKSITATHQQKVAAKVSADGNEAVHQVLSSQLSQFAESELQSLFSSHASLSLQKSKNDKSAAIKSFELISKASLPFINAKGQSNSDGAPESFFIDPHFKPTFKDKQTVRLFAGIPAFAQPMRTAVSRGFRMAGSICQGAIGDCWLLASLSTLASLGEGDFVVDKVVREDERRGIYLLELFPDFVHSMYVMVDARFPASSSTSASLMQRSCSEMVLARSRQSTPELWPSLFEKSLAKALGGEYSLLVGGSGYLGMSLLDGGVGTLFSLSDIETWSEFVALFELTQHALNSGGFVSCGSPGASDTNLSARGIVQNHEFSIFDAFQVYLPRRGVSRFFLIRNPWGSGEWKGAFSDGDASWTEDVVRIFQSANRPDGRSKSDDGLFWILLEDFVEEFCTIDLYTPATINKDNILKNWASSYKIKESSVGVFTAQNCTRNFGSGSFIVNEIFKGPMFAMQVQNDSFVRILVSMNADRRKRFLIKVYDSEGRLDRFLEPDSHSNELSYLKSVADNSVRSMWKACSLKGGKVYVIIILPLCDPAELINKPFTLSVVSETGWHAPKLCHLANHPDAEVIAKEIS